METVNDMHELMTEIHQMHTELNAKLGVPAAAESQEI
jgi:hypothetical protein